MSNSLGCLACCRKAMITSLHRVRVRKAVYKMLLFLIYSRLDVKQEAPLLSHWLLVLKTLFRKNHQHNKTLMRRVRGRCHPFKAVWVSLLTPDTVEPCYNEVSRYRKNVLYIGVFVIAKTPL